MYNENFGVELMDPRTRIALEDLKETAQTQGINPLQIRRISPPVANRLIKEIVDEHVAALLDEAPTETSEDGLGVDDEL